MLDPWIIEEILKKEEERRREEERVASSCLSTPYREDRTSVGHTPARRVASAA